MKKLNIFSAVQAGVLSIVVSYVLLVLAAPIGYFRTSLLIDSLRDPEILFAVVLSLKTSTISAILSLLLGTPVAYFLSRTRFPGKGIVDTILDLPTAISPIAMGSVMLILFNLPMGQLFQRYFFPVVFTVNGIIVAQTTITLALTIRLIKTVFDGIDPSYEWTARLLGESKKGAFFRVTLPMARQGILSALILAWARALGEFGATVTLAGATKFKTETLPIAIYLNLASVRIEKAVVLTWILVAMSCIVSVTVRFFDRRREA